MQSDGLSKLLERWLNDPTFRSEIRRDPESAIKSSSFELSEDEAAAVRAVDWTLPDEELQARASKC